MTKKSICCFILSFLLLSCNNKPAEGPFCSDCGFKTDGLNSLRNVDGFIVWLDYYNKYGIQSSVFNERLIYIACEFPAYFQPVEMSSVKFSGEISEYQHNDGMIVPTSFNCIKLDTIYTSQVISREITGRWNWIMSYTPGQFNEVTPLSTGNMEIIEFSPFQTLNKFRNDTLIDFGTFSTGHGYHINPNYPALIYSYDSIVYYKNGIYINHDYYKIYNDTIRFWSGYKGLYGGGSYFCIRIKTLR
jgi:hypothetical protein